jgi:hypothetical protein
LTIPPEVRDGVEKSKLPGSRSTVDVADEVISYLFRKYKQARAQQASEIFARLELYKWPAKPLPQ